MHVSVIANIIFCAGSLIQSSPAADKPMWEDMTEIQEKIKLKQELTGSEFEGMAVNSTTGTIIIIIVW